MRIETIFGAVAVLTLIALAAVALSSGGGGVRAATVRDASSLAATEAGTGACACYEQAFSMAATDPDYTRPAYEGGFGACREASGRAGGEAWSAGWRAGMEGRASARSCRAAGL